MQQQSRTHCDYRREREIGLKRIPKFRTIVIGYVLNKVCFFVSMYDIIIMYSKVTNDKSSLAVIIKSKNVTLVNDMTPPQNLFQGLTMYNSYYSLKISLFLQKDL